MKRKAILLGLMAFIAAMSITLTAQTANAAAVKIKFAKSGYTILKGGSVKAKISHKGTKKISFKSSNKHVAAVDKNGKVTAKGYGEATITVTGKNGSKSATDTLVIKVPKIEAYATKGTICVGEAVQGTAKVSFFKSSKVRWSSSNTDAVRVNNNGVIVGRKPANGVVITATSAKNKKLKTSFKVSVAKTTINSITGVSNGGAWFIRGESDTLTANTSYSTSSVKWTSSNTNIVTVKAIDKRRASIVGKGYGKATVTASIDGTTYSFSVEVPNVTMDWGAAVYSGPNNTVPWNVEMGTTDDVTLNLKYSGIIDKVVSWSIDQDKNNPVISCLISSSNNRTCKITPLRPGKATVTAKCGNTAIKFEVNVPAPSVSFPDLKKDETKSKSAGFPVYNVKIAAGAQEYYYPVFSGMDPHYFRWQGYDSRIVTIYDGRNASIRVRGDRVGSTSATGTSKNYPNLKVRFDISVTN